MANTDNVLFVNASASRHTKLLCFLAGDANMLLTSSFDEEEVDVQDFKDQEMDQMQSERTVEMHGFPNEGVHTDTTSELKMKKMVSTEKLVDPPAQLQPVFLAVAINEVQPTHPQVVANPPKKGKTIKKQHNGVTNQWLKFARNQVNSSNLKIQARNFIHQMHLGPKGPNGYQWIGYHKLATAWSKEGINCALPEIKGLNIYLREMSNKILKKRTQGRGGVDNGSSDATPLAAEAPIPASPAVVAVAEAMAAATAAEVFQVAAAGADALCQVEEEASEEAVDATAMSFFEDPPAGWETPALLLMDMDLQPVVSLADVGPLRRGVHGAGADANPAAKGLAAALDMPGLGKHRVRGPARAQAVAAAALEDELELSEAMGTKCGWAVPLP